MAERKMIYLDDAINALESKKDKKAKGDIGGFYNKIVQNDIDALMKLPPAESQRMRGKWIHCPANDQFSEHWGCSVCGHDVTENPHFVNFVTGEILDFKFCPHCGADMREDQE